MTVLEALLLTLLFIGSYLSVLPWLTRHRHSKATEAGPQRAPASTRSKAAMRGGSGSGEEEMKQVFGAFDKNKDGFITKEELGESLRQMGISGGEDDDNEVCRMVERLDSNGDGLIDFDEFSGVFDTTDHRQEEEELREAFGVFDGDKDGLITVEELGAALAAMGMKEGEREESCREMIRKVDLDGDGMVSFDEFKRMMTTTTTKTKSSHGGSGGGRLVPAF